MLWKKIDISLLFFFILSVAICSESYKLGIGSPSAPLPGFFPFLTGLLLGGASGGKLFNSLWSSKAGERLEINIVWRRVLPLSVGFFAYVLLIDVVGFSLVTFLFVFSVLQRIESKPWWIAASVAIGILFSIRLIFQVFLGVRLPGGFVGF